MYVGHLHEMYACDTPACDALACDALACDAFGHLHMTHTGHLHVMHPLTIHVGHRCSMSAHEIPSMPLCTIAHGQLE